MKCQNLLSVKNKKNISKRRLLKFLHTVLNVKSFIYLSKNLVSAIFCLFIYPNLLRYI